MPVEAVVSGLLLTAKDPQYREWNTTTLDDLMEFALGTHGEEAKTLALQLLDGFAGWYNTQKEGYVPTTGFVPMYKRGTLIKAIEWLREYHPEQDRCIDDRLNDFEPSSPASAVTTGVNTIGQCVLC
jgi:hypothetical protein